MRVQSLGHVVLNVRDLQRSEAFYSGVLGTPVISRISDPVQMTFFTPGNHHVFATIDVGEDAPAPDPSATGLAHVAFKVGDSLDEFDATKRQLEARLRGPRTSPSYCPSSPPNSHLRRTASVALRRRRRPSAAGSTRRRGRRPRRWPGLDLGGGTTRRLPLARPLVRANGWRS